MIVMPLLGMIKINSSEDPYWLVRSSFFVIGAVALGLQFLWSAVGFVLIGII